MAKLEFTRVELDGEEWRRLPLCGAWVSNRGRVMAVARPHRMRGYQMVSIPGVNGGQPVAVHRLVAHAFHGPAADDWTCVDHIDNDPSNNRPENLQYVSRGENTRLYFARRKAAGLPALVNGRRRAESF